MFGDFLLLYSIVGFIWVWKSKNTGVLSWTAKIASLGLCVLLGYFTAPWGFYISIYLRYLIIAFYMLTIVITFKRLKKKHLYNSKYSIKVLTYLVCIAIAALSVYNLTLFSKGYYYDETPVKLSFPFKNGVYLVYWGGNGKVSPSMNYHYNYTKNENSKYAVDMCKLYASGKREKGVRSKKLEDYAMYGETIYSPCDGVVTDCLDVFADIEPISQPSNNSNYITMKMNDNTYIRMDHLKNDSLLVGIGDMVKSGQPIAKAGNSGMTDVPHLHIQAMTSQDNYTLKGLPIFFDGKYPAKNTLFFK